MRQCLSHPIMCSSAEAPRQLLSLAGLSEEDRELVEASFAERNKERILMGVGKYESVADMTAKYMDFEGKEKGLTLEEAEDEVIRYLRERGSDVALAGGLSGKLDPQEIVTFGLLIALVAGVGKALLTGGLDAIQV